MVVEYSGNSPQAGGEDEVTNADIANQCGVMRDQARPPYSLRILDFSAKTTSFILFSLMGNDRQSNQASVVTNYETGSIL